MTPRVGLAWAALSLLKLPSGWDTYGGRRISKRAALRAAWLALTMRPAPSYAVPTSAGGVMVGRHNRAGDYEVEIGAGGWIVGRWHE